MSEDKNSKKKLLKLPNLKIFEKLKNIKHIEIIVCILFIGILLVIYLNSGSFSLFKSISTKNTNDEDDASELIVSSSAYIANMEDKLKTVLEKMNGVSSCEVMITLKTSSSIDIAYKTEEKTTGTTKEPVLIEINGEETPLIVKEILPEIYGVLVVYQGTNDVNTKLNIYKAIQTIFDCDNDSIIVVNG